MRRGSFIRLGLEVAEGCVSAGFLLRDQASGTTLSMPLLAREDGLALSAAVRLGLAMRAGQHHDAAADDFNTALGGEVFAVGKTKKHRRNMELFAERLRARGSDFYSVTVERVVVPNDDATASVYRAKVAVWLPERTPVGAYELRFACDGIARTEALPLVVQFHPHAATTDEHLADKAALKAGLADQAHVDIGPLRVPFQIKADWAARDAALLLLSKLPIGARSYAEVAARIGHRGPIQLTGRANYGKESGGFSASSTDPAAVVAADIKAWNDATGHYDLWDGDGSHFRARPGSWSRKQQGAQVIFGSQEEDYAMGAKKGLIGTYTFDDAHSLDYSGHQLHGKPKYTPLPTHTQVTVRTTVHFVDDWQGEAGFLKLGTSAYDPAFIGRGCMFEVAPRARGRCVWRMSRWARRAD